MVKIVSVKFKNGNKPYYFAPGKDTYEKGMGVIVETAKGLEYATVIKPEGEVDESEIVPPLKPVVRIATPRDEEQLKRNAERKPEAMKIAEEKIAARELEMRLVDCEFSFDGSKVTFYFTADSRVDFRELIKDLSSAFRMRIELRQIGIREEIKLMGGLAPCGRECCCVRSMPDPCKVSVKMAKNQGLSLTPGKISGLCGRLMCCLSYENEYYADACKKVPKLGSEVDTPDGKGTVVNVNMLKMQVKVKIEQGEAVSYHEYAVDRIKFMRGNVMMGKIDEEDAEGDDADVLPDEEEGLNTAPAPAPAPRPDKRRKDKHSKDSAKGGSGEEERRKDNSANNNKNNRPKGEGRPPKREGEGKEHRADNGKHNNKKRPPVPSASGDTPPAEGQAAPANVQGGRPARNNHKPKHFNKPKK